MHNAHSMELLGRIAAAFGISLVLTLLLLLLFQADASSDTSEALEASGGNGPTMSESAIHPVSLR